MSIIDNQFGNLIKARNLMLSLIKDLSIDQLNKIPDGFKNNIAWNIGHLVVTQQLLCYRNAGLPCLVSDQMIESYKKGTIPVEKITIQDFEEIKSLFLSLPEVFEKDYNNGLFKQYKAYPTSTGIVLSDIATAIKFNFFHEGIHLGVLMALKKLV